MTESHGDLDSVKTRSLFWEASNLTQMREELTATDKTHDEEDLVLSLEDVVHANKEWMISLHQNVLLQFC